MRIFVVFTIFLLFGLVGERVQACPVCYGEHNDAPIFQGAEAAMLFLLGFTYSLIGGGLGGWWLLRRQQRRDLEETEAP